MLRDIKLEVTDVGTNKYFNLHFYVAFRSSPIDMQFRTDNNYKEIVVELLNFVQKVLHFSPNEK